MNKSQRFGRVGGVSFYRFKNMANRKLGRGPYVDDEGGGKQPRARTKQGNWRKKRKDAKK